MEGFSIKMYVIFGRLGKLSAKAFFWENDYCSEGFVILMVYSADRRKLSQLLAYELLCWNMIELVAIFWKLFLMIWGLMFFELLLKRKLMEICQITL